MCLRLRVVWLPMAMVRVVLQRGMGVAVVSVVVVGVGGRVVVGVVGHYGVAKHQQLPLVMRAVMA